MPLTRRMVLAVSLAGFALAACGQNNRASEPKITLDNAWMRLPPGGREVSAAYLVIENNGGADTLLSVSSAVAEDVQMHTSETKDGITRMRREKTVPVPAHGRVRFSPTGRHLMMFGVHNGLKAGDKVSLTLVFQRFGSITTTAMVGNKP